MGERQSCSCFGAYLYGPALDVTIDSDEGIVVILYRITCRVVKRSGRLLVRGRMDEGRFAGKMNNEAKADFRSSSPEFGFGIKDFPPIHALSVCFQ